MVFNEVRVGDGLRHEGVLFIKTSPAEFCPPVSREPLARRRLRAGGARERILQPVVFLVGLGLAAGTCACSSKPQMAAGTPHEIGIALSVSPTATPSATPSPSQ